MSKKRLISRPLDLLFFIYFASHIPITLALDLQAIIPASIIPSVLVTLKAWYVEQFKDPFVAAPDAWWFKSFLISEAFLQLPFFIYAIFGLLKDSPKIRLPLVIYGSHTATTTAPLLFELWFNNHIYKLELEQQITLTTFYLPYLLIPLVILWDSYCKVNTVILSNLSYKGEKVE